MRHELTIGSFLRRSAEANPQKTYLFFENRQISYSEFLESVNKASRAFQDLNIGKGDKICLLLRNCPEFLFAWLALAQIGAVAVFINTALKEREIHYIANHSEAKAILTTSDFLRSVRLGKPELTYLQHPVICVDAPCPEGAISFPSILNSSPPQFREYPLNPDDVAAYIYTSGTTGMPKAVMQTHQTYVLTGESIPLWLGLGNEDRLFTCLPLFHINAQAYSAMGSLGAGASLVLSKKFSASSFWGEIKTSGATEVNLLGAMPHYLLKQPAQEGERNHRVRIAYTAPALNKHDHEEFERRFGVTLAVGYGMSECTFGTITPLDKGKRRLGSIGLPRAHPQSGNQLRIVDDEGSELAPLKSGEIILKNSTVMKGISRTPRLRLRACATVGCTRETWLIATRTVLFTLPEERRT